MTDLTMVRLRSHLRKYRDIIFLVRVKNPHFHARYLFTHHFRRFQPSTCIQSSELALEWIVETQQPYQMKLLIPKVCWDSVFPWAFCPHIQQDSWLMCSSSSPQVWRANFVDVAKREWLIEEELLLPTHPPWQWLAKDGLKERKHNRKTLLRLWWSRVCPTLWIILPCVINQRTKERNQEQSISRIH